MSISSSFRPQALKKTAAIMPAFKSITFLALLAFSALSTAKPSLFNRDVPPQCATCNPTSGLNQCDITTSCITTGQNDYCACRAGFKAVTSYTDDLNIQFRLNGGDFANRVYVPPNTPCDVLCDDPFAGPGPNGLCSEVPLAYTCVA